MLFYDFDEPNESERYFKHAEKIKAVSGDDDIIDTMINLGKNNIKLKKIQENRESGFGKLPFFFGFYTL